MPHHNQLVMLSELVLDGVTFTRRRLPSRCKYLHMRSTGVQALLDEAALESSDSSDGEVIE